MSKEDLLNDINIKLTELEKMINNLEDEVQSLENAKNSKEKYLHYLLKTLSELPKRANKV